MTSRKSNSSHKARYPSKNVEDYALSHGRKEAVFEQDMVHGIFAEVEENEREQQVDNKRSGH